MTKVFVKFDLNDENDAYDYEIHKLVGRYREALNDIHTQLRTKVKYTGERGSYSNAYDIFWEIMEENNLTIEDIL
jgi:hypothetical protein